MHIDERWAHPHGISFKIGIQSRHRPSHDDQTTTPRKAQPFTSINC